MTGLPPEIVPLPLRPFARWLVAGTPNRSGIYFLMHGDDLVYIGQGLSVVARVRAHPREKEFTVVYSMLVDRDELDAYEGALIRYFSPPLNRATPRGGDDAAVLALLDLDPSLARRQPESAPPTIPPTMAVEPDDIDEDRESWTGEDLFDFWEMMSDAFPLLSLCAEILVQHREHSPCYDDDKEPATCTCLPKRRLGLVIEELINRFSDGTEDVADAYVDESEETIYVTWGEQTVSRFQHSRLICDLMFALDEDGPWTIVVRCQKDEPGKFWTLERRVFKPDTGYLPLPERLVRAVQEQISKIPISDSALKVDETP